MESDHRHERNEGSMSVPEAVERTVSTVAYSLRGNPLCLAAIMLSVVFAGLSYMALTSERHDAHQRAMALIDKCVVSWDKK
jgi:hypothetical protein